MIQSMTEEELEQPFDFEADAKKEEGQQKGFDKIIFAGEYDWKILHRCEK